MIFHWVERIKSHLMLKDLIVALPSRTVTDGGTQRRWRKVGDGIQRQDNKRIIQRLMPNIQ